MRLGSSVLLALLHGCGETTAVEVVLTYGSELKVVRLRGTLDDGTLLPQMEEPLPPGESGSLLLLFPDRLDGRTLDLTIEGMTDAAIVGARWSGSIEVRRGDVVRAAAALLPRCGDGLISPTESCDDEDLESGDGCSPACTIETGWRCTASPSICIPYAGTCGNGLLEPPEASHNLGRDPNDGCSADCLAEDGFVCFGSPHRCVVETELALVDAAGPSCPFGTGQGTRADPFCSISDAVAARSTGTIVPAPGIYEEKVEISGAEKDLLIAGARDVTLASATAPALKVKGLARVRIEGIVITGSGGSGGGVRVEMGGSAELEGVIIGPSSEIGIDVKDGDLTLKRSRIFDNLKGGARVDGGVHRLISSVIARNGSAASELGGLFIVSTSTRSELVNDTIADNQSKPDRTAGVRCMAAAAIANAIVWNNSGGAALGIDPLCTPYFSDLAAFTEQGAGNVSADPIFADGEYHLSEMSPCIDAGDHEAAPLFDVDGDPRPLGAGADIGADEVR
jgi:cysteine-rich repeat protein